MCALTCAQPPGGTKLVARQGWGSPTQSIRALFFQAAPPAHSPSSNQAASSSWVYVLICASFSRSSEKIKKWLSYLGGLGAIGHNGKGSMPCERDPLKTGLWIGKSKFFILPCTVCCGQAKELAAADFSLKALFFIDNYWYAITSLSSSVKLASKITFCLGFLLGHLSGLTMEIFHEKYFWQT